MAKISQYKINAEDAALKKIKNLQPGSDYMIDAALYVLDHEVTEQKLQVLFSSEHQPLQLKLALHVYRWKEGVEKRPLSTVFNKILDKSLG